jgi:hypothetical protein
MNRWYYRTANHYEGYVWADSDDDAWNKVVDLSQQSPLVLRRAEAPVERPVLRRAA